MGAVHLQGLRLSRELRAQSVAALTIINRHSLPLRFESAVGLVKHSCESLTLVEMKGFEPLTPCLQGRCSPS